MVQSSLHRSPYFWHLLKCIYPLLLLFVCGSNAWHWQIWPLLLPIRSRGIMSIYTQKWINMVLPNIRASLSFFPSSVSPKQPLSNLIHGTKDLWWVMWAYLRLKFTMNILPVALLDPCHWLRGPVRVTCLSGRFFFPFCLHSFSLSLYCLSLTQSRLHAITAHLKHSQMLYRPD